MEWFHTISIIASVIGSAYYIHREVKSDIAMQTSRIDATNARQDAANSRQDTANARMDQLYQMFIDLLKEGKCKK